MTSRLDTYPPHAIKCTNPKCGEVFEETYRRLLQMDEVVCPHCGTTVDIREAKRTGEIGKWIDTITELDEKLDKKE